MKNEGLDEIEALLIDRLVRASIQLQPEGCCGNDAWRGLLCGYHNGFRDGAERVLAYLRAVVEEEQAEETP